MPWMLLQHPIVAAPKQNAAIFERDKQQILILGWIKTWGTCDDSIQCRADVPGTSHLFCDLVGQSSMLSTGSTSCHRPRCGKAESDRCPRVDGSVIMRIRGKGPDVSFHDFLPGVAAVVGSIAAIGYRGENDLRPFAAAGQVFEL
jgi:hypothetical protein